MQPRMPSHRVFQRALAASLVWTCTSIGAFPLIASCQARSEPPARREDRPYFEFEVESPVRPAPGSPKPAYPRALRSTVAQGLVQVQFVVDTLGIADTATFRVLKASHPEFVVAVREILPALRYLPARTGGRRVRQVVSQEFRISPP